MGKFTKAFIAKTRITAPSTFIRPQNYTYLNATEWRNVEMAIEFGEFLLNDHSLFAFPYFSQIADIWRIHRQSVRAARQHETNSALRKSDYKGMSFFIALFTTMELFPKAFLSLFLRPFMKKDNKTEMQSAIAKYYYDYGHKLTTLQFYDHDHVFERERLKAIYNNCEKKTMTDRFSWWIVSSELRGKQLLSKIIRWFLHGSTGAVTPDKTQVIVKYKDYAAANEQQARLNFQTAKDNIQQNEKVQFNVVGEHVYVKPQKAGKTYTTVYARLDVPRYMTFKDTLSSLENAGLQVRNIAGNEYVQVKCTIDANSKKNRKTTLANLKTIENTHLRYTYKDRINPNKRFCMFDIPVKQLQATVTALENTPNTTVNFIHNF